MRQGAGCCFSGRDQAQQFVALDWGEGDAKACGSHAPSMPQLDNNGQTISEEPL